MKKVNDHGLISKAETARQLKVSRQMVNKYIKMGMPVDESGRMHWELCKKWHANYVCSHLSGSFNYRQRTKAAKTAPELTSFQIGGMHVARCLRHPATILQIAEIAFEICGDAQKAFCVARNFEMYVTLTTPVYLKIPDEAPVIEFPVEPDWKAFAAARGAQFNSRRWEAAANKAAENTWAEPSDEEEDATPKKRTRK